MIPFYVFRDEEGYHYHPPIKDVGEKGLKSMFNDLFEKSLSNKIRKNVSPNTLIFNKFIEPLIKSLNENNEKDTFSNQNLLGSMGNLNLILIGLYRLNNWGWINEKEYIQAQKQIIEQMTNIMPDPMEIIETNKAVCN